MRSINAGGSWCFGVTVAMTMLLAGWQRNMADESHPLDLRASVRIRDANQPAQRAALHEDFS